MLASSPWTHSSAAIPTRAQPGRLRSSSAAATAAPGQHAERRVDRQQPAAEEAALRAHVEVEEDREDDEQQPDPPVAPQHHHRAGHRGEQRRPAEPPGQRAEVVEPPERVVLAELGGVGLRGLAGDLPARLGRVEDHERVEDREDHEAGDARDDDADDRAAQLRTVALHAQRRREQDGDEHRPRRVLRRGRDADRPAREQPVLDPPGPVREQAGDQAQRDRRERHHVVERVLGVEDGQEGDGHHRGGDEPGAAVGEAHAGPVREADDERPDQRDDDARGEERRGGVRAGC